MFEFEYCKNPNSDKSPNEHDFKFLEYCELLMRAKEAGLGFRVEINNVLYLAPTPLVKINRLNQFHSDRFPAIRWKEADAYFFLNGVNFPKELWEKVVSRAMPFGEILAIRDIDQRTQAMRYGNVTKFLEHTNATLLSETPRGNKLYAIPVNPSKIFTENAYFAVYKCPSTGRVYMSGIPKEVGEKKDADEALAWKHHLSKTEYLALTPLINES